MHVCFNLVFVILQVLLSYLVTCGWLCTFKDEIVERLQGMLQLRARLFHGQASGYVSKPENRPCHWLCSVSLKESLHFLAGAKSFVQQSLCVRLVDAEWGHPQSYSQTPRSVPSAVTILKSLNFLGSARQFCPPPEREAPACKAAALWWAFLWVASLETEP